MIRHSSLVLRQAFGILILEFAALVQLAVYITCIQFTIRWLNGSEEFGIPPLIGFTVAIGMFECIIIGLVTVGTYLVIKKK